jgi:hypothetical protein
MLRLQQTPHRRGKRPRVARRFRQAAAGRHRHRQGGLGRSPHLDRCCLNRAMAFCKANRETSQVMFRIAGCKASTGCRVQLRPGCGGICNEARRSPPCSPVPATQLTAANSSQMARTRRLVVMKSVSWCCQCRSGAGKTSIPAHTSSCRRRRRRRQGAIPFDSLNPGACGYQSA